MSEMDAAGAAFDHSEKRGKICCAVIVLPHFSPVMPITESDRTIFKQWFREPIELLIEKEHTGFALMMTAMPLIERLLRGRCKIGDQMALPPEFYDELRKVFPVLCDEVGARAFWQSFRHGILHQATFSLKGPRGAEFSGYVGFEALPPGTLIVLRRSPGHLSCLVDPIAFARAVLDEVEKDFQTFQEAEPEKHPIAFVTEDGGILSVLIRTRGI